MSSQALTVRQFTALKVLQWTGLLEKQQNLQSVDSRGGWWRIIGESFPGAWQSNVDVELEDVLTYSAVYACVRLISSDISKLRIKLVEQDANGIWTETESAAYSPVLRRPNHYQNRIQFLGYWVASKLIHGNSYILKVRNARTNVQAMYVLDPSRVRPLVAENGDVFYELKRDTLSEQPQQQVLVPASEIIHDVMIPTLFHPLVGISPISACGLAAVQALKIQNNSTKFFANGSNPGGVLTAPGPISDATAQRLKEYWEANYGGEANTGRVAVLGDGLKFERMIMSAVDAQLIEQLKWTAEDVCRAFLVPPHKIGVGPAPTYNNIEALNVAYYVDCLQNLIECIEILLDEGLGLAPDKIEGRRLGVELEVDDMLRMDTATLIDSEQKAQGIKSPNESRLRLNLKPVEGGETPMLQQQNWSLEDLAKRREMAIAPKPSAAATPLDDREEPEPIADKGIARSDPEAEKALLLMKATKRLRAA